jgi:hypothetical protein
LGPENDECETAFNVAAFPFSDSASLDFASGSDVNFGYDDDDAYANNCYNVRPSTKSVWYLVEGDGSCYTASAAGSTFKTVVAIYDGPSCDRLSCSAQSEYGSDISWETQIGETYYILVGGLYDTSGFFSLSIEVCDRTTIPQQYVSTVDANPYFCFVSGLFLARRMRFERRLLYRYPNRRRQSSVCRNRKQ